MNGNFYLKILLGYVFFVLAIGLGVGYYFFMSHNLNAETPCLCHSWFKKKVKIIKYLYKINYFFLYMMNCLILIKKNKSSKNLFIISNTSDIIKFKFKN